VPFSAVQVGRQHLHCKINEGATLGMAPSFVSQSWCMARLRLVIPHPATQARSVRRPCRCPAVALRSLGRMFGAHGVATESRRPS
jgi:hypothetical protein